MCIFFSILNFDLILYIPEMPFHNVPLLVFNNNISLTQSGAICHYLASDTEYYPKSIWEQYLVANYLDTFQDIRRGTWKSLH